MEGMAAPQLLYCNSQQQSYAQHTFREGCGLRLASPLNLQTTHVKRTAKAHYYRLQVAKRLLAHPASAKKPPAQEAGSRLVQLPASIQFPPLQCRFPLTFHPDYESVREEGQAWGLSVIGASAPAEQHQAFLDGNYHLVGTVFFPNSISRRRLLLLTKLTTFTFIFDDVSELTPPEEAAQLMRATMAILKGEATLLPPLTAAQSKMAALVWRYKTEVWDEMCKDMSPSFKETIEGTMLTYIQSSWVDQGSEPHRTVEEYMSYRASAGGLVAYFNIVEYSLGMEMGDKLTTVPLLAQLRKALVNHYLWANDLFSFPKELAQDGEYGRGIVGFFIRQAAASAPAAVDGFHVTIDLQEIIDKVWQMIQQEELLICGLVEEIKTQFPPASEVTTFVDACCAVLPCNLYWYTASGRYGLTHVTYPSSTPTTVKLNRPSLSVSLKSLPF
ncbi:hypothetical protein L7F22_054657 [Adiantum nelumboides]|nr:hypothetical protein [Adiantum nelumboides]